MAKALVVGRSGSRHLPHEVWTVVDGERRKGAKATDEEMVEAVSLHRRFFPSWSIILDVTAEQVVDMLGFPRMVYTEGA